MIPSRPLQYGRFYLSHWKNWIMILVYSSNIFAYSNIFPTRCNITQFILSGNCSTCFGWYHHRLSGPQTTASTASGIFHTVTAACRCRGRVGTGLSVLWVASATHNTLKPVPTLQASRRAAAGRSPAEILGSNPTGGMDICLL